MLRDSFKLFGYGSWAPEFWREILNLDVHNILIFCQNYMYMVILLISVISY